MANVMRYSYLRGPGGRFRNPYDQGIKKNCSDFLINGYNEDEECNNEPTQPEGIGMVHMARTSDLQNGLAVSHSHSHQTNGNSHVVINVNKNQSHGHVHSSHCNHAKTDSVPLGLGLGLGLSKGRS